MAKNNLIEIAQGHEVSTDYIKSVSRPYPQTVVVELIGGDNTPVKRLFEAPEMAERYYERIKSAMSAKNN